MAQIKIELEDIAVVGQVLSGIEGKNIKEIERLIKVEVFLNKDSVIITGEKENIERANRLVSAAIEMIRKNGQLDFYDIEKLADATVSGDETKLLGSMSEIITRTHTGKPIRPKTLGQLQFIDCVRNHDLTFAIGPAGTGKTYLAVCYAVELLKRGTVSKIILTRPAVEAGENLGFLPGDLKEKVDPYLRPLYDALDDMLSAEKTQRYIEKGVIEIAPLAYMRGRTLDDAMVILDEAQNTTRAQMIMFLSRLGRSSKMIVNGDLTQIDLMKNQESGLRAAKRSLEGIPEISFVNLTHADVVRHPLVVKVLKAFEKDEFGEERDGKDSNYRR